MFIFALPYLGLITKRPLWTAVSMVVTSCGLLLCTVPFFYKDPALYDGGWNTGDSNDRFCNPNAVNITNEVRETGHSDYKGSLYFSARGKQLEIHWA